MKGKYFLSSKEIVTQAKWDKGTVVKPGRLDGRAWGKSPMNDPIGAEQGLSGGNHPWLRDLQNQDSGHRNP